MIDAYTWFRRAETQLLLKGVSNPTSQAAHVLAAIPDKLFPRISEWLQAKGDAAVEYDALKTYLLKHFTLSQQRECHCSSSSYNILVIRNLPTPP